MPTKDTRIALEAGGGKSLFVARELMSCGFEVLMVDPFRTSRFFESAKSDRLDAVALAELLARGLLDNYPVWMPDDDTRRLREVIRARRATPGRGGGRAQHHARSTAFTARKHQAARERHQADGQGQRDGDGAAAEHARRRVDLGLNERGGDRRHERFLRAIKLRGYSGLAPKNEQSGERRFTGPFRLRAMSTRAGR